MLLALEEINKSSLDNSTNLMFNDNQNIDIENLLMGKSKTLAYYASLAFPLILNEKNSQQRPLINSFAEELVGSL